MSKALRPRVPKESAEGAALMQWAHYRKTHSGLRISEYLIHIPNGAHLAGNAAQRARQMNQLKLQGLRVGCADYFLAIPVATPFDKLRAGLWIELKRQKATLSDASDEQLEFLVQMRSHGYAAELCMGWQEAAKVIDTYLGGTVGLHEAKPAIAAEAEQ